MSRPLLIEIIIPTIDPPIKSGVVIVTIEDTTQADIAAKILGGAQIQLNNFTVQHIYRLRIECPIDHTLQLSDIEVAASLRRHLKPNLTVGDYVSAAASPVSSAGSALVHLIQVN